MRFFKLRCLGFKSFVEPAEFLIEAGLTGIVGPNGCGKSNLVEALRWVMGENSYRNMRASGMDDVIFSGSANRPSRNSAEVTLFLDNEARDAPAAFNDADELQVTRRIERGNGSVYRINGREVRARDVQLLFADASTGARSPSMVGQGRVGELIAAKPQARRALLEEAAGISGLHSRRHEAELRLRAADQNLDRLEDVLAQIGSQIESLKRQARQANRYRMLSEGIHKHAALLLHLKWAAAAKAESEAQSDLSAATLLAGEKAAAQAAAARDQALAAARIPHLRQNDAEAAASAQRLTHALAELDRAAERLAARRLELEQRIAQIEADITRESAILADNDAAIGRLHAESGELRAELSGAQARQQALDLLARQTAGALNDAVVRHGEMVAAIAREQERRGEFERAQKRSSQRIENLQRQLQAADRELAELEQRIAQSDAGPAALLVTELEQRVRQAEEQALAAEAQVSAARLREQNLRPGVAEAEAARGRLATEAETLRRILGKGQAATAILEQITVQSGYEAALGAAFGADLELPADSGAPAHWREIGPLPDDPELPRGIPSLAQFVKAPAELSRALSQIGVVTADEGASLQSRLRPGQSLVTLEGDLWRWDGMVAGARAPTAAAQKLAQRNRLVELDREIAAADAILAQRRAAHDAAKTEAEKADQNERAARDAWRKSGHEMEAARRRLAEAERNAGSFAARRVALSEARQRIGGDLAEESRILQELRGQQEAVGDISSLQESLAAAQEELERQRAADARARADAEGFSRECAARERRMAAIAGEIEDWRKRAGNAQQQIASLRARREECAGQLAEIADSPAEFAAQRAELSARLDEAQMARQVASRALMQAEEEQAEADRAANEALLLLAKSREETARCEERLNSARERKAAIEKRIAEELHCAAGEALRMAGLSAADSLPDADAVERELEKLKADRDRLGPVNLRAEAEQGDLIAQRDNLTRERDDLIEAIKRLRQGIAELNREGRGRLMTAFEAVNGHFSHLFTHLFGGGTAQLQLVESDDPLEAGIEILARPPGKRPQTMTLLSGGEQALTALALIFAVFLTNPAPVCVLDEVDAPLDDHNVERFCNLLDEMAASTQTRFIIITHNPITMSRVNRLFGVTMAERGVSQLVSVNLEQAEKMREAG